MALLDNIAPTPVRGVVRIDADCQHCGRPVPALGSPGKGRPLDTFPVDYFCRGHAERITA